MSAPPPYPRIPHLVAGRGTRDDKVLTAREVAALLSGEVVVEEKLDGANVVLWSEDGIVRAGLRGGPGSADRAGQLGPLRAWVAGRHDALVGLLGDGEALYAEWLYLTHTVAYDRLPTLLFALDLRLGDGSLVPIEERDGRAGAAGLAVPPELWRGVPGSVAAVEDLLGPSRYGPGPAEGVVVRATGGSGQM
ncbi:MAG: RNA ligase family protein, partial [Acidimicrobiales bacterium]